MVFKGTECCALECELNKAEAAGEGRRCRWVGVMGNDATLNGLLVSRGGKVECFPSLRGRGQTGWGSSSIPALPHQQGWLGDAGICCLLTS